LYVLSNMTEIPATDKSIVVINGGEKIDFGKESWAVETYFFWLDWIEI